LGVAFAAFAAVMLLARLRAAQATRDYGATTIVAAMLTFGFGALAVLGEFALATAGAVATSVLLSLKPTVHRWLARIDHADLVAVLKLMAISLVLLPALPDRGFGPWQALNPFRIWLMVVLVAVLSFAGYVAMRVAGARRGLTLASVAGGLVSSTAVAIAFARIAGANPRHRRLLAAGVVTAATVMLPRLLVLVAAVEPTLLGRLAGPIAVAALVGASSAVLLFHGAERDDGGASPPLAFGNPLSLAFALQFGALLALVTLGVQAGDHWFGDRGVLAVAALSGLADVDAITLSLTHLVPDAGAAAVTTGILLAAGVNTAVKVGICAAIGGGALIRPAGLALAAIIVAGAAAYALLPAI
jgi:uncharacterized membrane protein (DUF4010 family)